VPVFVDDEGTKATDTTIIEEGILKGFMHIKNRPTTSARSSPVMPEPTPFMTSPSFACATPPSSLATASWMT
jgi:predicted Zn-dependent protease